MASFFYSFALGVELKMLVFPRKRVSKRSDGVEKQHFSRHKPAQSRRRSEPISQTNKRRLLAQLRRIHFLAVFSKPPIRQHSIRRCCVGRKYFRLYLNIMLASSEIESSTSSGIKLASIYSFSLAVGVRLNIILFPLAVGFETDNTIVFQLAVGMK